MTRSIRIIAGALALLAAAGCGRTVEGLRMTQKEADAMEFLNTYMSSADKGDYSQQYFLDNVKVSLKARKEMSWGKTVPDQLFRHFVLPLRVNNERLDDFRTVYYDTLKARVAGLSMHDAALEEPLVPREGDIHPFRCQDIISSGIHSHGIGPMRRRIHIHGSRNACSGHPCQTGIYPTLGPHRRQPRMGGGLDRRQMVIPRSLRTRS